MALGILSWGTGCKTFSDYTAKTRSALDANDLKRALSSANGALGVRNANDIPEPMKKNDALLLLDRAMVLQALHEYRSSSVSFEVADKTIELLDFSRSTADEIMRYMFTDSAGPYKARPYEKLMLNSLNMLNYLAQQNLQGAKVEARRFSVMREFLVGDKKEESKEIADAGAFGSYLAGYTFEKAGDVSIALRYYDEVLQSEPLPSLAGPVARLIGAGGYRTNRLEALAKQAPSQNAGVDAGDAEVLVVVSYGRIPAMVAKRVPIGLALSVAAVFLPPGMGQQARRLAGQGLVTWVNYPEMAPTRENYPVPAVIIDGAAQPLEGIANVDAIARQAWNDSRGRVMAAAVVRTVTRAALGAGVGVAVGQASNRGSIGVLASLVTQAALAAGDKPDTRSWATLPARIGVARVRLRPGTHEIAVNVGGRNYVNQVTVAAGQWVVLDITDLSTR